MKPLAIAAVAVALVASLSACGDDRPCLRGHTEIVYVPVPAGKTTVLVPTSQFVCDQRGPKPRRT